ncbi:MAG: hypothetical protein MJ252_07605 [archaeon]|nr:hypothetical protein [archaeon]
MYQSLNKLKEQIELLTKDEMEKLTEFQEKLKKFIKNNKYEVNLFLIFLGRYYLC